MVSTLLSVLYGPAEDDRQIKQWKAIKGMNLQSFKESLAKSQPPDGLSYSLRALWWDAKGDWGTAHECAQERDDEAGMRVHAYLHRKEGDLSNAEYWYRRCRIARPTLRLDEEWEQLSQSLLDQQANG